MNTSKPRKRFDAISLGILIVFCIIGIVGAVLAFFLVRNIVAGWTLTNLPGAPLLTTSTPEVRINASGTPIVVQSAEQSLDMVAPSWDGGSRVTLLAMGLDYRDWEAGERCSRTDTMMLVTVDPVSKTAGMLSIPRDLWVSIPGFNYGRINTAYYLGCASNYPGGGPALAMKTVESFIGVPIQYYAQVDFSTFVYFIDYIIGGKGTNRWVNKETGEEYYGLDMKIKEQITVDPLGKGNTMVIYPGEQALTGDQVLAYARMRYTKDGDFDRATRQQEIIMAIRRQIFRLELLPDLVSRAPMHYEKLSAGIHTNLPLQDIMKLTVLAGEIDEANIVRGVFDPHTMINYSKAVVNGETQEVLRPVPDQIRVLRDQVFTSTGPLGPLVQSSDPIEQVKQEQPKVVVQSGVLSNPDLATRTGEYFKTTGMNVLQTGNADQAYAKSQVIFYASKPNTLTYLQQIMNLQPDQVINNFDPNSQVDVVIILGDDWAASNPLG